MFVTTINISPKGQIVLPKKIRNILNTDTITLTINDQNQVILSPVSELGGALADYNENSERRLDKVEELLSQDQKVQEKIFGNINDDTEGEG